MGLPQDIQTDILLVAFNPYIPDGLMFTSSAMMRIINPHHSKKQQAGPCHEKLNSVRQKASEGHGQMQQHKVAMTNAMQWSPLNSPLHSGAGALTQPVIHPRSSCISAERQKLLVKPLHRALGVKFPLTVSHLLQPLIPDSGDGEV